MYWVGVMCLRVVSWLGRSLSRPPYLADTSFQVPTSLPAASPFVSLAANRLNGIGQERASRTRMPASVLMRYTPSSDYGVIGGEPSRRLTTELGGPDRRE